MRSIKYRREQLLRTQNWRERNKDHVLRKQREWSLKHPGYFNAKNKERATKARIEMLVAYGSRCKCCGEQGSRFLTMDHVHNNGKIHRTTIRRANIALWLKQQGWPKKDFQLLCWNCQMGKALNGGICPHKTRKVLHT